MHGRTHHGRQMSRSRNKARVLAVRCDLIAGIPSGIGHKETQFGLNQYSRGRLEDFAEREIDAKRSRKRMRTALHRRYTVINESCRSTPDNHVAAVESKTAHRIGS